MGIGISFGKGLYFSALFTYRVFCWAMHIAAVWHRHWASPFSVRRCLTPIALTWGQLYLFYVRYTSYAALIFLAEKCVTYVRSAARDRARIEELQVRLQHASQDGEASDSRLAMHFLSNALQRCYVIMHGVQQQAADAIKRIDTLINYALNVYARKSVSLVPLAKEVMQLKEMMALDRVNSEGGPYVDLYLPDDLRGYKVPALTFITCYENILKHGITNNAERSAVMRLDILADGYQFTAENHVSERLNVINGRAGMGLESITKRLLVKFGDKFDISYKKENGRFYLSLRVWG